MANRSTRVAMCTFVVCRRCDWNVSLEATSDPPGGTNARGTLYRTPSTNAPDRRSLG